MTLGGEARRILVFSLLRLPNVKIGEFEGTKFPQEKLSHIFIAVCAAQPHRMANTLMRSRS